MQDPKRSVEQRLALSCYWFIKEGRLPSAVYRAASREWLTKAYPLSPHDHRLMEVMCYTLAKLEPAPEVWRAQELMPSTLHLGYGEGWAGQANSCHLTEEANQAELTQWASTNVWARFLQRYASYRKPLPGPSTSEAMVKLAESRMVKLLRSQDMPFDVVERARHLVTMAQVQIGSYTRFRRDFPSLSEKSISAADIAMLYKVDLSQIPMHPLHHWDLMSVGTQQIWLASALAWNWTAHTGDESLGKLYTVFPSELGMSGVASRLIQTKCPNTHKPQLPMMLHLGEDAWLVVSPSKKAALKATGVVQAYDTWRRSVAEFYKGKTPDGRPVPSLEKLTSC